jgi:hypothetical protein
VPPWHNFSVIVVGELTELRVVPPFDADNPDPADYRIEGVLTIEEYLKGTGGETAILNLSTLGVDASGKIRESVSACQLITSGSVGDRFVFFSNGPLQADPGYCGASRGVSGANDSYVNAIREGLRASGSPSLSPTTDAGATSPTTGNASPTVSPSAASLPRSGGSGQGSSGPLWPVAALVAIGAALTFAAATMARRRDGES